MYPLYNIKESVDNIVKFKMFSTVPSKEPSQYYLNALIDHYLLNYFVL